MESCKPQEGKFLENAEKEEKRATEMLWLVESVLRTSSDITEGPAAITATGPMCPEVQML